MSQAVEALARRGLDPVVVEDDEPGEHVLLAFPFGYGDLTGVFDAISHFVNGVTRIVVAVPFAWIDVDRLKLVDLALPIDDWEIDLGDDEDPGDNEVSPLLLVSAVVESGSLDDAIEVALTGLTQFASALVDQAMLGFGDAEDDDEVADLVANLMSVKASDPAEALRRVRLAAALSRDLGDQLFASQLEVAEAELLLEFGSVLEARRVAETAWARIGEPADQVELLTVVARARARSNDLEDACALMRRGLAAANDDASIARLQGNLGIILIENGERVEGMAMLTAALNNYGLSGDDRAVFTAQRSISRDIDGAARSTIYEGGDVLDALNSRLNRVSSLVLSGDLRAISAVRPEIDALLAEIIPMLDVAGDLHRARVLHAQASLAYIDRQHLPDRSIAREMCVKPAFDTRRSGGLGRHHQRLFA